MKKLSLRPTIYFLIFLVFLRCNDSKLVGTCSQCLTSNEVACLNENHFSICYNGSATPTITKCPNAHVCTDDEFICRPSAEGYMPICYNEYCGECEISSGVFACVDDITYGYCFKDKTPHTSTLRSCPPGLVCNHNYRQICMPAETTMPSCPAKTTTTEISTTATDRTTEEAALTATAISSMVETTTTTTEIPTAAATSKETALATETAANLSSATETAEITATQETSRITETTAETEPLDANTICGRIRQTGYFKSADATCRQSVYCYLLSGQYLGWFYYCEFYFNAATQQCQEERPSDCVAY